VNQFPRLSPCRGVPHLHGLCLLRRQAIVSVGAVAQKCCRIEMALEWVRQQAVLHSVDCVACGEHGAIEEREFGARDNTRRALEDPRFHCDFLGFSLKLAPISPFPPSSTSFYLPLRFREPPQQSRW